MADKCWFTLDAASKPVGPYSMADLTGYAKSGYVSESQLFWKEGKDSWDKLAGVPELEAVLTAAREFKPSAAAADAARTPRPRPQPQPHAKVITAKPSDPLEVFKHEIAAVEAGEAADQTAARTDAAAADDDREQTPDELEFEDDDGTLYRWDHKLRKYIPAAAAAAGPNDLQQQQQQQQQQADYDMDAMTFVQEEEFIPTLAAARAADEAAAAAAGKDAGKWDNKRPADADASGQSGKKARISKQDTAAAAPATATADETAAAAAEDTSAVEAAATKQQEDQPKGWFDLQVNTSVYVTGLPDDTDIDEVAGIFAKCGIIKLDDEGKPKIKLYRDRQSDMLKGDGLVTYLKEPSVDLACQILDGDSLRPGGQPMSVTVAKFEMKGGKYQERKKGKNNNQNNKSKGKGKKKAFTPQEKLERKLGWYGFDDVLPPEKVTVVLKQMFTLEEAAEGGPAFATELEADVLAEATKLGVVEKVRVYAAHPEGVVTVKFKQEEPAHACVAKMNGRFFGGRQLIAHMWDGFTYYHAKAQKTETPEEEAARLEAFARELEQQQVADVAAKAAAAAAASAAAPMSADDEPTAAVNGEQQ